MSKTAEQLLEEAMGLPVGARAALAAQLIESLDELESEESVDDAWMAEVQRRLAEVDAGTARLVPGDVAIRQIAAAIRRGENG
jgi:putative addiction module component (TIGR02574 family)